MLNLRKLSVVSTIYGYLINRTYAIRILSNKNYFWMEWIDRKPVDEKHLLQGFSKVQYIKNVHNLIRELKEFKCS